ncbi:unnamed protein product, partial [Closterium sp. Naga37s-1]
CVLLSSPLLSSSSRQTAGDITPSCGVGKEEKHQMEKDALRQMCAALFPSPFQQQQADCSSRQTADWLMIAPSSPSSPSLPCSNSGGHHAVVRSGQGGEASNGKGCSEADAPTARRQLEMIMQAHEYEQGRGKRGEGGGGGGGERGERRERGVGGYAGEEGEGSGKGRGENGVWEGVGVRRVRGKWVERDGGLVEARRKHVTSWPTVFNFSMGPPRTHRDDLSADQHAVPPSTSRPGGPPHLRVTGLDTTTFVCPGRKDFKSRAVAEVGRRLKGTAMRLGLPFEFEYIDIDENQLHLLYQVKRRWSETLVVCAHLELMNFPDDSVVDHGPRDCILRWIHDLKPALFTFVEMDLDSNARPFLSRFQHVLDHHFSVFCSHDALIGAADKRLRW